MLHIWHMILQLAGKACMTMRVMDRGRTGQKTKVVSV
jgi:hypothetical protein